MTIVGCRIDGRLIHGQVANLWAGKLNVSRIMVVDDEVVNNDIEKSGLKLATPPGVKLSILPVEKAAANILAGKYDSQRLFIVARKPDRFLGLVEAGVPLETLNVDSQTMTAPKSLVILRLPLYFGHPCALLASEIKRYRFYFFRVVTLRQ